MLGAALLLLASAHGANAVASCYPYEPKSVTLSGVLIRKTFPGRPNYANLAKGDEPETYFLLRLSKPVCTVAPAGNGIDGPVSSVAQMQLVFLHGAATSYKELQPYIGKEVRCTGKLFSAETGHHHTPVLMTVKKCKPVSNTALQLTAKSLRALAAAELRRYTVN